LRHKFLVSPSASLSNWLGSTLICEGLSFMENFKQSWSYWWIYVLHLVLEGSHCSLSLLLMMEGDCLMSLMRLWVMMTLVFVILPSKCCCEDFSAI
jgi:hypothetical protein